MTICKFYANGYCRYGNSCRFEHNDSRNNYHYENPNYRNRQQSQQFQFNTNRQESEPRIGFSFNRTLQSINKNTEINYNERQNTINPFQSSFNTFSNRDQNIPKVQSFSFNQTLQQLSTKDNRSAFGSVNNTMVEEIDMEMNSGFGQRSNSLSRESRPNSFGIFSQTNVQPLNVFPNKTISPESQQSAVPDVGSTDIYSNESDLLPNEIKEFHSQVFTFRLIPTRPPPQHLCF